MAANSPGIVYKGAFGTGNLAQGLTVSPTNFPQGGIAAKSSAARDGRQARKK
jgi:hypothetical protein